MAQARSTAAASTSETATKQYVVYKADNHFMARELTAANVRSLGASEGKKLRWDKSNDFRIERSEIPLNDDQLQTLLEGDDRLKLVEG